MIAIFQTEFAINISLNNAINNIPALGQIIAWCRPGDKPLSGPMMVKFIDAYMRHWSSMSSLNSTLSHELNSKWSMCYQRQFREI